MQDFGTKADNSPPPGGQLSAAEFNNLATENENAVLRSGIALSGASATQLAESIFLHSVKSDSFQDSGVANAYVATPISGSGGVLLPATYANLGGATISFKVSASNSGASTLNIGQTTGTLLGVKAIVDQAGNAISAGVMTAGNFVQLRYDPSIGSGSWVLLPWSLSAPSIARFTGAASFTVPAGVTTIYVSGCAGGGGGGGSIGVGASTVVSGAGGGAAGEFLVRQPYSVTPGQVLAVTVGSGGSAGGVGGNGGNGGATALGALFTLAGGTGGLTSTTAASGSVAAGPPGGTGVGGEGGTGCDSNSSGGGFGGMGANGPYGNGGSLVRGVVGGTTIAGKTARGFGTGGGGAGGVYGGATGGTGSVGGAAGGGLLIIEW